MSDKTIIDFIKNILIDMKKTFTCTIGYNNYAFDDEYTRNLAYRNLFDPYEREWDNNNSRFDVYFLMLATYVLRPNLIKFPTILDDQKNKVVSLKLEDLTKANNIKHSNAHDAFSDVVATLLMMKLVKSRDEDFFKTIFNFRFKDSVLEWMNTHGLIDDTPNAFIHISPFYGKISNFSAPLIYICTHPTIKTRFICLKLDSKDMSQDLDRILHLNPEEIQKNVFSKQEILDQKGETRLPVSFFDINKCPIITSIQKSGIPTHEKANIYLRQENVITLQSKLSDKLIEAFGIPYDETFHDSDMLIYSGFFGWKEKNEFRKNHERIEKSNHHEMKCEIDDNRCKEMIFKVKARNFESCLMPEERRKWKAYKYNRLRNKELGAEVTLNDHLLEIEKWESGNLNPDEKALYDKNIIDEIKEWVNQIISE